MDNKQHLDDLKKIHDYHATQSHILKTRVQFYYEEFDGIKELVAFSDGMAKELSEKIKTLSLAEEAKAEVIEAEKV